MPNIEPHMFGPSLWTTMKYVALGYPDSPTEENKQQYCIWFRNLANVIPCEDCAKHYEEILDENPPDEHTSDSQSLFAWVVSLHNAVNRKLGKPEYDVKTAMLKLTERPYMNLTKTQTFFLSVSVLVIILILMFYK